MWSAQMSNYYRDEINDTGLCICRRKEIFMDILFRKAKPEDAGEAPQLIYSAGVEGFDYVFRHGSTTALDFLSYAFLKGEGLFGFRNHTVVEADGRIAGIGAFYSGHEYNSLSMGTGKLIFKFYGPLKFLPVVRKSFDTLSLMPPPGKNMEYVSNLGVAEGMRSKGIGTALLTHQMEVARSKGRQVYALDVSMNNSRAQQLYERLGLKVTGENRFRGPKGSGVPDTRRMELYLEHR